MSLPSIIKLSQTVWQLWPAQDFGFRGDKYIRQELSFLHATLLLGLIYVPISNIIKLSKKVWEFWPAQEFDFRGDKYITRAVSLASYTPTGPLLYPYQI